MNLKPEYKQRLAQALLALILVILSVAGSIVTDQLTAWGESPVPAPEPVDLSEIYVRLQSLETAAPVDTGASFGVTNYDELETDAITTGDITATGDATLANATIGYATITGQIYPGFTDLTVNTAGQSLTPAYTVYALNSAAAISMTLAADAEEGQLLVLIGDDNYTITVNDTNLRSHDGNALAIGQYDVALLVYQDSEWLQIAEVANQ